MNKENSGKNKENIQSVIQQMNQIDFSQDKLVVCEA
jgi:hypothetical protein